ncbi:MAG: aminopeptidase P family protein [Alphaproteobacteria bacterium]|nr:aminopeptidase P family protein [Alphaproteobacteria bacterium]MBV8548053.1 aminopeptidase P family protein [Alphaproteobacteria bacterium]
MTFDATSRLSALKTQLVAQGLDGFLVPMSDEYQSEYVPDSAKRITFLSGFTGSAGFIVVLGEKAAFFTDGRYTLQAQQQVGAPYIQLDINLTTPSDWVVEQATTGQTIGFDPWLMTHTTIERLQEKLNAKGIHLRAATTNPVDAVWLDHPAAPAAPIHPYDTIYAGETSADKRTKLATELRHNNTAATIITDPASIAWLLNVRGGDVPNTPLPLSFAILYADAKVDWFVDPRKITDTLPAHVGSDVTFYPTAALTATLEKLAAQSQQTGQKIRIDPTRSAYHIVETLVQAGAKLDRNIDPCELPKACKNVTELDGMRAAHRRDGAALTRFLCWLDGAWINGDVTELSAEETLAGMRTTNNLYRGPSFDTIAGAGAHGAIVHYRATQTTNKKLEMGQLFLLDSGGQYLDGTTDVTRTVAIGKPTDEMRDRFTRVLKGHIALASICFPPGTTGAELDVLARQYLWEEGLDFNHGTGHGVGSYLGVHEGPQNISRRSATPLKPGMVVSNEPGFYKTGEFGIRIENLQAVVEIKGLPGDKPMLGFETLTLAPIDRHLIAVDMLTPPEKEWLDAYHARVRDIIMPQVDADTAAWIADMTQPIDKAA